MDARGEDCSHAIPPGLPSFPVPFKPAAAAARSVWRCLRVANPAACMQSRSMRARRAASDLGESAINACTSTHTTDVWQETVIAASRDDVLKCLF